MQLRLTMKCAKAQPLWMASWSLAEIIHLVHVKVYFSRYIETKFCEAIFQKQIVSNHLKAFLRVCNNDTKAKVRYVSVVPNKSVIVFLICWTIFTLGALRSVRNDLDLQITTEPQSTVQFIIVATMFAVTQSRVSCHDPLKGHQSPNNAQLKIVHWNPS